MYQPLLSQLGIRICKPSLSISILCFVTGVHYRRRHRRGGCDSFRHQVTLYLPRGMTAGEAVTSHLGDHMPISEIEIDEDILDDAPTLCVPSSCAQVNE